MTTSPSPSRRTFTDEVLDDRMAEILRSKTPAERLAIAFGMWSFARQTICRVVAHQHPEWSEANVNREVARRMSYGAVGSAEIPDGHP
jgi:hypothetical protein